MAESLKINPITLAAMGLAGAVAIFETVRLVDREHIIEQALGQADLYVSLLQISENLITEDERESLNLGIATYLLLEPSRREVTVKELYHMLPEGENILIHATDKKQKDIQDLASQIKHTAQNAAKNVHTTTERIMDKVTDARNAGGAKQLMKERTGADGVIQPDLRKLIGVIGPSLAHMHRNPMMPPLEQLALTARIHSAVEQFTSARHNQ